MWILRFEGIILILKKHINIKGSIIILYLIINLVTYQNALSEILQVPHEYPSISNAVEQGSESDTILVHPGDYFENIRISVYGLTLASLDILDGGDQYRDITVIHGTSIGQHTGRAVEIDSGIVASFTFYGLTFRDGKVDSLDSFNERHGGGIWAHGNEIYIVKCAFKNNRASFGGGVSLNNCHGAILSCHFEDNFSTDWGGGCLLFRCPEILLQDTKFLRNHSVNYPGGGFSSYQSSGNMQSNQFIDNTSSYFGAGAAMIASPSFWIVENNDFTDNISLGGSGLFTSTDSIYIISNKFIGNEALEFPNQQKNAAALAVASLTVGSVGIHVNNNVFLNNISYHDLGTAVLYSDASVNNNVFAYNSGTHESCLVSAAINLVPCTVVVDSNLFYMNTIFQENDGSVGATNAHSESHMILSHNDFIQNEMYAIGYHELHRLRGELTATNNYYGSVTGPYHVTYNPNGQGDTLHPEIDDRIWSRTPFTDRMLPLLRLNDENHTFGEVFIDSSITWNLKIWNNNVTDLILYGVQSTNPAFSVDEIDTTTLGWLDTLLIPVNFAPPDTGLFSGEIQFSSSDPRQDVRVVTVNGTGVSDDTRIFDGTISSKYVIGTPYPNPLNSSFIVPYEVPTLGPIRLVVFNLLGRSVMEHDIKPRQAGTNKIRIDASELTTGVYFLRLYRTGEQVAIRKVVLIR